jgi:hypothetical protein
MYTTLACVVFCRVTNKGVIMIVCIEYFYRQHTRSCDWEIFDGHEKFLDQIRRKGDKLSKRMMHEQKQPMCKKYLKVTPS